MKIAIALISALTLSIAGEAAAKPHTETREVTISYADLQLSTEPGRATLEKRLNGAVRLVCGPRPMPADLRSSSYFNACVKQASAIAKQEMARVLPGPVLADGSISIKVKHN